MRSLIIALALLTAGVARADDEYHDPYASHSHDAGMDRGAVAALTGGILLAIAYPATAIAASAGDSMCSLDHNDPSCNTHAHANLEIPLIGGFLYSGDDKTLPILSSVVQLAATGLIIGGLAVHKWHVDKAPRVASR
jgi:hypothetical protein